jgi:RimJ/RimL family protein N-acetyltransferase
VLVENEPVWRLHQSFGFTREALFRQHIMKQEGFVDVAGYGLLRDEWLARRADSCARLAAKGFPAHLAPAP